MSQIIITGPDGMPTGSVDLELLKAHADLMTYRLAASANDDEAVTGILQDAVAEWGSAYGMLAATALREMLDGVVAPLLEVMDELHAQGIVTVDVRSGFALAVTEARDRLSGGDCE